MALSKAVFVLLVLIATACAAPDPPSLTPEVRSLWNDQLSRRDDLYYWLATTVGREARQPSDYVAPTPGSLSVPFALERIRSRSSLPGGAWENVLVLSGAPLPVIGPVLDIAEPDCRSCALWFAYDANAVPHTNVFASPGTELAERQASNSDEPIDWMRSITSSKRPDLRGIVSPEDMLLGYPYIAALNGHKAHEYLDDWWSLFESAVESDPASIASYRGAAFIGLRLGAEQGRRAVALLATPEWEGAHFDELYFYLYALFNAKMDQDLRTCVARIIERLDESDYDLERNVRGRLRFAIALSLAHLGNAQVSRDFLISAIDDVDFILRPRGTRPFQTTAGSWRTSKLGLEPLTLEEVVHRIYVVHPEFDSITSSELHAELWRSIDLHFQSNVQTALDLRERGEPLLGHPADYSLARRLVIQRTALDPLLERLELP